jgi:hypothetical protein
MALEPVADLTEVVGFRRPDALDDPEIDRWLDEGGSHRPEPLAEAVALELPV